MNKLDRKKIESDKNKLSIKTMYFNRYLFVRYMTALLFFINLYWFIMLLLSQSIISILPLFLLIFITITAFEQFKIFSKHTNNLKITRVTFIIIAVTYLMLSLSSTSQGLIKYLYPFLKEDYSSIYLSIICNLFILMIAIVVLIKLRIIRNNKDRQYERIQKLESILN